MSKVVNLTISKFEWGRVELEDGSQFKDVMLAPGFCAEWNWKLSRTNHTDGVQIKDIDTLLSHGIDVLILSRGVNLKLNVLAETYTYALSKVPTILIDQTNSAVEHYNRMAREGYRIGALIHSTC